jgi:hypothetical protein
MKGSGIQLVSQGAENIYLNLNPEFSYFKAVYKRHTHFSIEAVEIPFSNDLKFDSIVSTKINKDGDLLSKIYLQVDLPYDISSNAQWTKRIGFNIIKKVELIIGNKVIDRHIGLWMHLWAELSHTNDKKGLLDNMVEGLNVNTEHSLIIPLQFSFCRHYGLALPLLAIYNEDIYIKFYMESKVNCIQSGNLPTDDLSNPKLWVDYIFVESQERQNILSNDLDYLFDTSEYLKKSLTSSTANNIIIPFTKPCKELIFAITDRNITSNVDKFTDYLKITDVQLKINSKNVYSSGAKTNDHTNGIVPYQCHTGVPSLYINCLTFSLYPENLEPSGFLELNNISRFSILLNLTSTTGLLHLFSSCYNILKIRNGRVFLEYN